LKSWLTQNTNTKEDDKNMSTKKIELEKDEELIITHKGSAWFIILKVDNYDDICVKKISRYHTTTAQKKALDILA
jgi:hypothetical protein